MNLPSPEPMERRQERGQLRQLGEAWAGPLPSRTPTPPTLATPTPQTTTATAAQARLGAVGHGVLRHETSSGDRSATVRVQRGSSTASSASALDVDKVWKLRRLFETLDEDGDGLLTASDLGVLSLVVTGQAQTPERCAEEMAFAKAEAAKRAKHLLASGLSNPPLDAEELAAAGFSSSGPLSRPRVPTPAGCMDLSEFLSFSSPLQAAPDFDAVMSDYVSRARRAALDRDQHRSR